MHSILDGIYSGRRKVDNQLLVSNPAQELGVKL
jgi:hypothetical protein